MANSKFDWLAAYDYQRRLAQIKAGEVALFRCTPAHVRRLTTLTKAWVAANPDKICATGLAFTATERRGLRVVMAPAPADPLNCLPNYTWMPRIATYLPD